MTVLTEAQIATLACSEAARLRSLVDTLLPVECVWLTPNYSPLDRMMSPSDFVAKNITPCLKESVLSAKARGQVAAYWDYPGGIVTAQGVTTTVIPCYQSETGKTSLLFQVKWAA